MTLVLTPLPYPNTQAITSRNLLTNPAMTSVTGWTSFAGTGGTSSLSQQTVGTMYTADGGIVPGTSRLLHTQSVAATSVAGVYAVSAVGSVTPGVTYTSSAYVAANPALSVQVRITFRNAAGTGLTNTMGAPVTAMPTGEGYRRAFVTAVAPANASYASIEVYSVGNMPIAALAVAAASISPGALAPYFDGYTAPKVGVVYAWAGTPHNSESTETTRTPTAAAGALTLETSPLTTVVTGLPEDRVNPVTLHNVIGRPDPLPALAPVRTRSGTMEVVCDTYARARAIVDLYVRARGLMMVRDPATPARDMYHVATSLPIITVTDDKRHWQVSVPYAEVYANAATGMW